MHSLLAGSLLTLAVLGAPNMERAECGNVAHRYSAAVVKLGEALRSYGKCVATSDKRDDCAAEIQALDDAHDDFADVVTDAKACR